LPKNPAGAWWPQWKKAQQHYHFNRISQLRHAGRGRGNPLSQSSSTLSAVSSVGRQVPFTYEHTLESFSDLPEEEADPPATSLPRKRSCASIAEAVESLALDSKSSRQFSPENTVQPAGERNEDIEEEEEVFPTPLVSIEHIQVTERPVEQITQLEVVFYLILP